MASKIMILEHRVHTDIADLMLEGAVNCIAQQEVECDVISVPDLFDLPVVVRYNLRSMELRVNESRYMGYVLLGTTPLSGEDKLPYSLSKIYEDIERIKLRFSIAVGVGIIETETKEYALKFASVVGREAAVKCFKLLAIKKGLGL